MNKAIYVVSFMVLITACTNKQIDFDKSRAQIRLAEKEFAQMAADSGIAAAFIFFAADSAVLMRGDNLLKGIDKIREYVKNSPESGAKLEWSPDFVDVAASGDLGYTYGKYRYSITDSLGVTQTSEGFFHTVWKKQPDGTWKYVWD